MNADAPPITDEDHDGSRVEVDKPFAQKVEAMAGYGLSAADIACVLAMNETELNSVYGHELAAGGIKANLRVAESLYRQATGDGRQAVTAAIFWLKTRARWKETSVHDHNGVSTDEAQQIVFTTIYESQQIL